MVGNAREIGEISGEFDKNRGNILGEKGKEKRGISREYSWDPGYYFGEMVLGIDT